MLPATIIMGVLAFILVWIGYSKGQGQHISGLKSSIILSIEIFPLLVFALIVAGMIQALISQEAVAKWVGAESGMRGILIGSVAGGLSPGGPFVSLPIAAGLMRAGAGTGTMVAYLTGWSLYAVSRLPMEVGILGWRLTFIRLVSVFIFPPLAGLIAHVLFSATE